MGFAAVAQPFDDASVAFHDRGRLAVSVGLLRTTVDVVQRPGRVHGGHVREEHGTVRGVTAAAQHFLVTVRREPQVLEKLLQVTRRRLGRSPVSITYIRLESISGLIVERIKHVLFITFDLSIGRSRLYLRHFCRLKVDMGGGG